MKELIFKPKGISSLGVKISLIIALVILLCVSSIIYLVMWVQKEKILTQEQQVITLDVQRHANQLSFLLRAKEQKAIIANKMVSQLLAQPVTADYINAVGKSLSYEEDGSVRQYGQVSGAFISTKKHNDYAVKLFGRTDEVWKYISPLILQDFLNFYFISKEHFVRVAPMDMTIGISAEHNYDNEIYYRTGTPENNPSRLPLWTPLYYEPVWKKWVISLVIPVYVEDEFLGVTGTNYILDDIISLVLNTSEWLPGKQILLFDRQGRVIASDINRYRDSQANADLSEGQRLPEPLLHQYITDFLTASDKTNINADTIPEKLIHTAEILPLNWYMSVYANKEDVLLKYADSRAWLLVRSYIIAAIAMLILQFLLYRLIVSRLYRLSSKVQSVALENNLLAYPREDKNTDEITVLDHSFDRLVDDMDSLLHKQNEKIKGIEKAELEARKLSKAVSFSSSGIVLTAPDLKIEYCNPFLLKMLNCSSEKLLLQPLESIFSPEIHAGRYDIEHNLAERQHWQGDVLLQYESTPLWVSLSIAPVRDEKGAVINYVCAMQDISFIKQSQKQMEHLAFYDVLTGLGNRSYFREQLRKAISMTQHGNYSFALLYFDLDEFKRINDTLGHDAGDELLKEMARRLPERLREEDTIARLGGDEFSIIISGVRDRKQVADIALNLQQCFAEPIRLGSYDVSISSSIGITISPEDSADEEILLKHADLAMYEAKARGKNTYHFFNPELNDVANERLLIESQLRDALKNQQFILYYQPKIDLQTERLIGYEALLRWQLSENELVPPYKFIPVAENTGQIVQIGEWVIWESCRFLVRQHSKGQFVSVSVNLSVRQFKDDNLPVIVARALERTEADPAYIILEITETMLMGNTELVINQLNQLKRLGVRLSIDDFGTGYSSLSYLKRLPVDEMKIDRSFVQDIPDDKNDMDIVAAIIAIAQKLNLNVVAEGVETSMQIDFLKANACFEVQGFYFSKPLPESQLGSVTYTYQQQDI